MQNDSLRGHIEVRFPSSELVPSLWIQRMGETLPSPVRTVAYVGQDGVAASSESKHQEW